MFSKKNSIRMFLLSSFILSIIFSLSFSSQAMALTKEQASYNTTKVGADIVKYFTESNPYIFNQCKRLSQYSFKCQTRVYAKRTAFSYKTIVTVKNENKTVKADNLVIVYNLYSEYKRQKRTKNLISLDNYVKEVQSSQIYNADAYKGSINAGLDLVRYFGEDNPYILRNCHRLSLYSFKCNIRAYSKRVGLRFEIIITQANDGIGIVKAKNLSVVYNRYKLYNINNRQTDLINRLTGTPILQIK